MSRLFPRWDELDYTETETMGPEAVIRVVLNLPAPMSTNQWPKHPMSLHKAKAYYMALAWAEALTNETLPFRDPPPMMQVESTFLLRNLRDEDNLKGSLKWALDAFSASAKGKLKWRSGIMDRCGYWVDDSPRHLRIHEPEQVVTRGYDAQTLKLTITEVTP